MNLLVIAGFRVNVPSTPDNLRGFLEFLPGMVVDRSDIPEDQSAQDWIDKGLVREVNAPPAEPPTDSGAPALPTP